MIYIYDGTFEGLLCAIYESFYSEETPVSISLESEVQYDLLAKIEKVETDDEKFEKVKNAIINKIDKTALNKLYLLYLSCEKNKGLICYNYLKLAFKLGSDVHKHLHLDIVKELNLINRRVSLESHRFTGLVRFNYINNKFLYSPIEPDNNILELISPHFQRRFSNEYWIIHDTQRGIASVYDKISWEIREVNDEIYQTLKDYKDDFHILWKNYFKSTTIEERINLKLQKRLLPTRYRKNLTEL